jgi:hypothetical protein
MREEDKPSYSKGGSGQALIEIFFDGYYLEPTTNQTNNITDAKTDRASDPQDFKALQY